MMGPTHRLWGSTSTAVITAAVGFDPVAVLVCAYLAHRTASVPDQIERVFPRLFRKHRGMSHSWLLLLPWLAAALLLPPIADYLAWGLFFGMLSHLTGDFLFGKAGHGRDAGVPLFFSTFYLGLGVFKVDEGTEHALRAFLRWGRYIIIPACTMWAAYRFGVNHGING